MEKLLYSKGDSRSIDSSCLQNTVKKLVANLCETLIFYRTHLRIEGTVGVTIDDERVIVLHFGEDIGRTCLANDTGSNRNLYETEKSFIHENEYNSGADDIKQDTRRMRTKPVVKDSNVVSALSEEAKLKPLPLIVTECESESNILSESSASESGKVKHSFESSSSFCEPLDSLASSDKNCIDRGQSAFGGRSEPESATLLDMTTDILSKLFNSADGRENNPSGYCYRGRTADEPIQGCRMRQGSAIEALRQLYSKRFSSQGTEDAPKKYLDLDIYPSTHDHQKSDSSGKIPNTGRKECIQNQVLLRELLFQKTNPATDAVVVHPPASKRRRYIHGNKGIASTSVAEMIPNNSGGASQKSRLSAFCLDEAGVTTRMETSSPEAGHSTFPTGMTFDQDTDSSNYKFSQLLFSLVDNKRHSANHLSPANSEPRQSGLASKNYDSTLFQTAQMSEIANVKQETDDSEYDTIEHSAFGS